MHHLNIHVMKKILAVILILALLTSLVFYAFYNKPEEVLPGDPLNLRNPIVEQVVNETLRLVSDIWRVHGRPYEIHLELSRELKKNAKERKELSETIAENENESKRIAAILREFKLGNPNSLADIERLKL